MQLQTLCRHRALCPGGLERARCKVLARLAPVDSHGGGAQQQRQRQLQRGARVVVASQPDYKNEAEKTTEKFGLEAGLWKVWRNQDGEGKSKGQQAKDLLKRYGSAYLLTSISFALVSMAICYAAVASGVDVASLLTRVGLTATDTSEKMGTFAIAYAAHKALSPVRFPPTVALTPVVARWLGKEPAPPPAASPGDSQSGGD